MRLRTDMPGIFSDFQLKLNQLLPTCSSSPEAADVVCQMIMAQLRGAAGTSDAEAQLQSVMGTIPAAVLPMTSGAYSTGERLYRYANTEARFLEEPDHGWTAGVEAETFVMTGDADHMTSPANSFELARRISGAHVRVVPGGDHYMHYLRPDIRSEIVEFFERGARRDVPRVTEAAV